MEHQPLRSADVRDRNQKLILRLLFQRGALSQSQVVAETGLKAPTVFRIFSKLEEEQYIRPCEAPESDSELDRRGRRPAYFCVVPEAVFAVGVDFSTFGASVILVNFVNDVIYHEGIEFPPGIKRDEVLSRVGALVGSAIDASSIDPRRLVGIGMGAPGTVDTNAGKVVEYSRIDGLAGFELKQHFQELFGVPVLVHNNASVIAASEYHYDTARDFDSVLAVLVRGGVGAALVNHGRIFLNGATTALEMGRTTVAAHEAVEGTSAVANGLPTLESIVGEQPLLEIMVAREAGITSWADVEARVPAETVTSALAGPASVLATSVRNIYHVLHPDAVLIISRYRKLAETLTAAVAEKVPEIAALPVTYDPVKACYGATDLVFQAFFSLPTSTIAR